MNVPIVYLCGFSIFLSLTLLFYNKGYKGANRFLSGYLFCSALFLVTQYFLIYSKSISLIAFFISGIPSLFFLICPFAYFYVRSIFSDTVKLSKTDYLHFLPFVLIFIGTIPFLFSSWEYKCLIAQKIFDGTFMSSKYNINFLVPKIINQLIRPPFALFYLVLISREFIKNKPVFKSFSNAKAIKIWLGLFYVFFSLTVVFFIIVQLAFYLNIKFLSDNVWFYFIINTIALLYLVFNFSLALFPQILYGLPIPKLVIENDTANLKPDSAQDTKVITDVIIENKTALFSPFFSNEYELEIESEIKNWIKEKKYLEANASILSISTSTTIPVHHLSYYFNAILKVKYTDWRNSLRIEYAKKQIDSGFIKSITLEALSIESGFATQSTFIKTFKNSFGCTPSDYIKTKQH
jgi:AraC-like DNA-binding protein